MEKLNFGLFTGETEIDSLIMNEEVEKGNELYVNSKGFVFNQNAEYVANVVRIS